MASEALATREDLSITTALEEGGYWKPRHLDDMRQVCVWIAKSGIAPTGFNTPEKIFIGLQTAMECGLPPLSGLRMLYVVHNIPSWRGTGALALIRSRGRCSLPPVLRYEGEGDGLRAIWRFQRSDMPGAVDVDFSVADAKQAGLWGKTGPWSSDPKGMLGWRACSRMADRYFSDILAGLQLMEVVQDFPAEAFEQVAAGGATAMTASGTLDAGEDPLLQSGTPSPQPAPTAPATPAVVPDQILEPDPKPKPKARAKAKAKPKGPSAVEAALGDQAARTESVPMGEPAGDNEPPPLGDTSEAPTQEISAPSADQGATGGASDQDDQPFCIDGDPTITKRKAGSLRGLAGNRCIELGLDAPDARFTLCQEALGCAADAVTDSMYEAAKDAIKTYEMP